MNAPTPLDRLALPEFDIAQLDALEEEAIFILRESAAAFERPALLSSGGKQSCVVLHLAQKAFKLAGAAQTLDIATFAAHEARELDVNEIGEVVVETQQPLPIARFEDDRVAGALLVVDPATHRTSGALLVRDAA